MEESDSPLDLWHKLKKNVKRLNFQTHTQITKIVRHSLSSDNRASDAGTEIDGFDFDCSPLTGWITNFITGHPRSGREMGNTPSLCRMYGSKSSLEMGPTGLCCCCCSSLIKHLRRWTKDAFHPALWPGLAWDAVAFMIILFDLWAVQFDWVFWPHDSSPGWSKIKDTGVFSFFLVDIVLYLLRSSSTRRLIRPQFILQCLTTSSDFFCAIGSSAVHSGAAGTILRVVQAVKLLRIFRLLRFGTWTRCCIMHFKARSSGLAQLVVLPWALLLLSHLCAVFWQALQPGDLTTLEAEDAYSEYLRSFWHATSTLTFGQEMPARNEGQQALGVVMNLLRMILCSCGLLWLFDFAMRMDQEGLGFAGLRHGVLLYLRQRSVSVPLQMQIEDALQNKEDTAEFRNRYDVLISQDLPSDVRLRLFEELWRTRLHSLGLVHDLMEYHADFAQDLTINIREDMRMPKEYLYFQRELSGVAYNLLSGVLGVVSVEANEPMADYLPGMWIGVSALINSDLLRSETIVCKTRCDLMVLDASIFQTLLSRFGMEDHFETLISQKLWLGLCGRCGAFGDHFSQDCPRLKPNQMSLLKPAFMATANDHKGVSNELLAFLKQGSLLKLVPALKTVGILELDDIMPEKINRLLQLPEVDMDPEEQATLSPDQVKKFRDTIRAQIKTILTPHYKDQHMMFISHYKVEAGTEASLMREDLNKLILDNPNIIGSNRMTSPFFIDSEDLRDLNELQDHVRKSFNLVLLLTKGVLTRPWCIVEIVTAMRNGVHVLPVEVQRREMQFQYPNENYFLEVESGGIFDAQSREVIDNEGIKLDEVAAALRQVFKQISLPFSPHKTRNVRMAELKDILKACQRPGEQTGDSGPSFAATQTYSCLPTEG